MRRKSEFSVSFPIRWVNVQRICEKDEKIFPVTMAHREICSSQTVCSAVSFSLRILLSTSLLRLALAVLRITVEFVRPHRHSFPKLGKQSKNNCDNRTNNSRTTHGRSPNWSIGPRNESKGRKNQVANSQLVNMINIRKKPICEKDVNLLGAIETPARKDVKPAMKTADPTRTRLFFIRRNRWESPCWYQCFMRRNIVFLSTFVDSRNLSLWIDTSGWWFSNELRRSFLFLFHSALM